ncbi:MAG TPA: hypothetical protein VGF53_13665 [Pseudolabrys sp.]|jgi:hypothetical protein
MRTNRNLEAIDRIADLSAKLADEAATIGLKSLVYILRMAEIEARQSMTPGPAPRKQPRAA